MVIKKTKRDVKEALANGGIKEAMTATGLSESQVYKYRKEIAKESRELNKKAAWSGRKISKLPTFTKKHNRQEAEKIVAARHNEQEKKDDKEKPY